MTNPGNISRRGILQLLGSSAALGFLAACGSSAEPEAGTGTPVAQAADASQRGGSASVQPKPSGAASTEPRLGGTLKFGLTGDLKLGLEPQVKYPNALTVIFPVHDRLAEYDDKLQVSPQLAESWEVSGDGKQYKLNLRKGVQFHSGREFTSDDVKYSITRAADPKTGNGGLTGASAFTDMQTPDKYTAILKMDQPMNTVFDFFNTMNIVDQVTMKGPDAKSKMVGTGPFSFVEWVQGQSFTMVKNKNYWMSGKPYLDGITYKISKDSAAQVVTIESGALDAVDSMPYPDVIRLQKDSNFVIAVEPPSLNPAMFFNTTLPPLDNPKVRQALNYAIDRKRIADTVWLGFGSPADLPWPPYSPAYDAAKDAHYTFDLDKAKSLLTEAGVSGGQFDFAYQNAQPDLGIVGQIYQGDLAKIGIKLNVSPLEPTVFADQEVKHTYKGIAATLNNYSALQPQQTLLDSSGVWWGPNGNFAGYQNPQYTQLLQSMNLEVDPVKFKQLAAQLNDFLLDVSVNVAFVSVRPALVTRSNVHGVRHTFGQHLNLTDAWLG